MKYPISQRIRSFWTWYLANLRGWHTGQKIVVIESDDWGSIRTSSREAYDRLVSLGYPMHLSPYGIDALETDEDLDRLFEVLDSVRDQRGRPACLTANMIMTNPDFDRIRKEKYSQYFYEPVGTTLARDPRRQGVARKWNEGFERKLFFPQLHGREHIRWWEWMKALQAGSNEALETFNLGMCGIPARLSRENKEYFSEMYLNDETLIQKDIALVPMVVEGFELFKKQFGFASKSTIAPRGCWTDHVEEIWDTLGIKYIQVHFQQACDTPHGMKIKNHFTGQKNVFGSLYMVRNCSFEPAEYNEFHVENILRDIEKAFRFRKPAIISSHRLNYAGSIDPRNRNRTLEFLKIILMEICKLWPDVNFLNSYELGELVKNNYLSNKR